jgi:hypothetical protein
VVAAAMFLVALTGGKLPGVTEGRWTFAVLWVVGLAMHKLSEFRDYRASPHRFPGPRWLFAVLAILGIASAGLLVAVIAGFDAVLWVVGLAATVAAKWVLVLAGPTLSRPRAALLAPGGSPLISSR